MVSTSFKQWIKNILPRTIYDALITLKYSRLPKITNHEIYVSHCEKYNGIEIGGPSILFKTTLPLYQKLKSLDGVNFTSSTVWEGNIKSGFTYNFIGNRRGTQFISDGTDLSQIQDDRYDFVLSSNCLEHIANPLKALSEWKRILRDGGALILVLPNKISNFDRNRSTTSFDHIFEDFNKNTSEDDLTHLDEILRFHDLSMDPPAGTFDNFKIRSLDNFNNRTLHHHVFDLDLMRAMFNFLQMTIVQENKTDNVFLMLAVK
jgi:SAM-dependent methyltransferase